MKKDKLFVAALCKMQEKFLLGEDRIARMVDCVSLDEGLRVLREASFGGDTELESPTEFENLIFHEQNKLTEFLTENCQGSPIITYALLENDFHNAQAVVRSAHVDVPQQSLYLPQGLLSVEVLKEALESGDFSKLPPYIKEATVQAEEAFKNGSATGYTLSLIFTRFYYVAKLKYASFNKKLKSACQFEIDTQNLATAMRCSSVDKLKEMFIPGGNLALDKLEVIVKGEDKDVKQAFALTPYEDLVNLCLSERSAGLPLIAFESAVNGYTLKLFKDNRYFAVEGDDPIVLYYLYKTNEIKNVRTVMVGLAGGMEKSEIKKRLRENYAG